MRGVLGIVLIGGGLLGAYLILSGKFPPQTANTPPPIGTNKGSGGESIQSSFNQLGYSLASHPSDIQASRGFKQ
jgi:hypothetical protein